MMNNIPRAIASVVVCLGLLVSISAKAASINIVAVESGGDVVISASGSIDLAGLAQLDAGSTNGNVTPSTGTIWVGDGDMDVYFASLAPPPTFGSGGQTFASSGTGGPVGTFGSILYVPLGYQSGDPLAGISSTYNGASFASLGMDVGTYLYTFTNGETLSLTVSQVPLPAAAWLFGSALLGLGFIKRKKA